MAGDSAALEVLARAGVSLTLVDVGASLEPFAPFRSLLGHATYVGFDPDLREMHTETSASGRRVIVNAAVVAEPGRDTARFYLTHNPTASSTLRPLTDEVAPYLHAYRYEVVDEAEVPATTLPAALAAVGLDRIDWIKLDTQGTDLRLLSGLDEPLFATLMAVDAEPGFDQHYETEDTFGELHREMVGRGFWMSDLELTRGVRLRRATFDDALGVTSKFGRMRYEFTLKSSPTAAGPRYLRTLASMDKQGAGRAD
ncbi:MAG TPA: FkbM family methyltransferase, partial [Acidimicrobiales bacterium]|nr:FkbM family methyltransferase [Acidimicrobiales bacterium]